MGRLPSPRWVALAASVSPCAASWAVEGRHCTPAGDVKGRHRPGPCGAWGAEVLSGPPVRKGKSNAVGALGFGFWPV